jgi:hypothetical protein
LLPPSRLPLQPVLQPQEPLAELELPVAQVAQVHLLATLGRLPTSMPRTKITAYVDVAAEIIGSSGSASS